jgi:hypothetical protein
MKVVLDIFFWQNPADRGSVMNAAKLMPITIFPEIKRW